MIPHLICYMSLLVVIIIVSDAAWYTIDYLAEKRAIIEAPTLRDS